jgi:hypothetical protein
MRSNGASGVSRYRQRTETEPNHATTADIYRIAEHTESTGSHITKPAPEMPLRPDLYESKASSAADDLPDHIRRFCQRFFSDNRSLF